MEKTEKSDLRLFGLEEGYSHDELKKAYRRLAKRFHPDSAPDNPQAHRRFIEVNAAYERLQNGDAARKAVPGKTASRPNKQGTAHAARAASHDTAEKGVASKHYDNGLRFYKIFQDFNVGKAEELSRLAALAKGNASLVDVERYLKYLDRMIKAGESAETAFNAALSSYGRASWTEDAREKRAYIASRLRACRARRDELLG
jgi:DnaJ-class molecular chaperone